MSAFLTKIQYAVVILLCVALGGALIDDRAAWHAYYAAVILASLFCLLRAKLIVEWFLRSPFWVKVFLVAIIMVGGLELSWSLVYGQQEEGLVINIGENYYQLSSIYSRHFYSGLAMVISIPLFICLYGVKIYQRPIFLIFMAMGLFVFLLVVLVLGIDEWQNTSSRVQLKGDWPITTAMEYFFIIIMLFSFGKGVDTLSIIKKGSGIIVAVCGFIFVWLTDTRSVLVLLTLYCIWYVGKSFPSCPRNIRLLIILTLSMVVLGCLYHFNVANRLFSTYFEIVQYFNGQPNTSMGGRFSMWKGSIFAILESPWSNGIGERYFYLQQYVMLNEYSNRAALEAMLYHVHNEYLDALSLKGIKGLLVMLLLFSSGVLMAVKDKIISGDFAFFLLLIMIYCLFDSFFIHPDLVMLFCVISALYFSLGRDSIIQSRLVQGNG